MRFNIFFLALFLTYSLSVFGQTGTKIQGPALIEGFTTTASAAGTTTLTVTSQTKQIITGVTTQTVVMPDATTLPLGRKFLIINKSSGTVTVNASGGGLLGTITGGAQAEVHLRAAGSAAGTWDLLSSSAGGGGTWGSITGTLSAQTDLQSALNLKAPLASPTFSGTITTPLTANRAVVTGASGVLSASATTDTQIGYLSGTTSAVQTQLDAKQARSTLTTKGDLYVATASATVARQGVGSNGQVLMSDSTQTNGVKWTTPTSENLIFDGNAESGITNFVEGSYSAATRPSGTFTASSGSGTFAISTSSSSPLFGSNSFLLTKSSGASRQGRAIERTIAIDAGYRTKMLKTRIDYTIVSGTFVAGSNGSSPTDSSLIWYVGQYNGSTWSYTEPSTFKMFSNSTTNSDWVEGEFQVNSDTTQLKLIGFISESANSAWVVKAEVGFRLSTYLAGTTVTDWVAYTPSNTQGLGTIASVNLKWRRVGDSMQIQGGFATGTVTGSIAQLGLPSGHTIGGTASSRMYAGETIRNGGSRVTNFAIQGATYLTFGAGAASHGDVVGSSLLGSSEQIYITAFDIPIQGWSSSTQQSDGYETRPVNYMGITNAGSIATTATTWTTMTFSTPADDTVAGWNGTDTYTVKSPGRYRLGTMACQNSAAANYMRVGYQIDATSEVVLAQAVGKAGGAACPFGSVSIPLNAGQTVKFKAFTEGTEGIGTTRYAFITKDQAPTTISATERVSAIYKTTSQTITNGGTRYIVNAATLIEDTHGSVTTGASWKFTAPDPGLYEVKYVASHSSVTITTGASLEAEVYKNGSLFNPIARYSQSGTNAVSPLVSGAINVPLNSGEYIDVREAVGGSVSATIDNATIYITKIK